MANNSVKTTTGIVMRAIIFISAPFVIAEAMAFGSFIFEEALQASGFAVRSGLLANDFVVTVAAVRNFQKVKRNAQFYQSWLGCFAFWTHSAYCAYFYQAAEAQLAGFYAEGCSRKLWTEEEWRFLMLNQSTDKDAIIEWNAQARQRAEMLGITPELLENSLPVEQALRPGDVPKAPKLDKLNHTSAPHLVPQPTSAAAQDRLAPNRNPRFPGELP